MPVEVGEQNIRVRVAQPGGFQEGSFRTIDIDKSRGIKAVIGKKKGATSTSTQSFIFDKKKWTAVRAETWVKAHGEKPI